MLLFHILKQNETGKNGDEEEWKNSRDHFELKKSNKYGSLFSNWAMKLSEIFIFIHFWAKNIV